MNEAVITFVTADENDSGQEGPISTTTIYRIEFEGTTADFIEGLMLAPTNIKFVSLEKMYGREA